MSFSYNIPNLLSSLRIQNGRSFIRNLTNVLTTTDKGQYIDSLRNLTEEYFLEPLKGLTDVDEFVTAGGTFNLPVFAPLVIEIPKDDLIRSNDKEDKEGTKKRGLFKKDSFLVDLFGAVFGFRMDGVSLSVGRSKNIVTTAIQGRDYTVKEFISNGDHHITVNGILATDGDGYPTAQVVQLRKILDSNKTLKVIHPILRKIGVFEIAVTDYEFPSNNGMKNIQPFSFNALSEVPLEIKKRKQDFSITGIGKSTGREIASNF